MPAAGFAGRGGMIRTILVAIGGARGTDVPLLPRYR